ncbi:peptidoglycan-binding protein [Desulfobacter postgatei]|uniref:Putative peptidoglycan-binding domain-containing protein n=1 Tax=Desulfobacter postgatei 2ac9 TaxID=879212 RepID=I5B762_9BACT|nr:peptidoglycan-binding protein [Desulfobacter postgatei]EIM65325.1 putative peptidoglycan-binding domain-containing protein [Desulfobacter postgatei 2ac9]
MALTKCKECGEEISKKAEKCPKCGAPAKKKTSLLTWIVTIFIVLWAIGYFSSPSTTSRSSSPSTTSSSSSNSSSYLAPREYSPPLEVISWKCDKEYSYVFVRGEVKNISSQSIKNVMAVGEFRTKDGTLVKSEDSLIDYNPILPGQTSPFKTGGTDNPAITNCNLSFKTLFGKQLGYTTAKDRKAKEREKIKEVQTLLSSLGYQVGVADGIIGAKTKQAIKEFQSKQGLTENGEISNQLIVELRRAKK